MAEDKPHQMLIAPFRNIQSPCVTMLSEDRNCVDSVAGIARFKTSNIRPNHIKYCNECFSVDMPSDSWRKRVSEFASKFTDLYVKV